MENKKKLLDMMEAVDRQTGELSSENKLIWDSILLLQEENNYLRDKIGKLGNKR